MRCNDVAQNSLTIGNHDTRPFGRCANRRIIVPRGGTRGVVSLVRFGQRLALLLLIARTVRSYRGLPRLLRSQSGFPTGGKQQATPGAHAITGFVFQTAARPASTAGSIPAT